MILGSLLVSAILIYYFFIYRKNNKAISQKCPGCGSDIEDSFNICPICKVTLVKKCPHCNARIEAIWNFCPSCEKPIEKSDEL